MNKEGISQCWWALCRTKASINVMESRLKSIEGRNKAQAYNELREARENYSELLRKYRKHCVVTTIYSK